MEEEKNEEQLESSPAEETAAETEVEQSPLDKDIIDNEEATAEADEESEAQPSRREARRIDKLSDKLRQESERANAYRQQLMQQQNNYEPLDYNNAGEIEVAQLERDRQLAAQTAYQQGMQTGATQYQQEMFVDRLELDAERVAQKYDVLDEGSENFDPDLTANINDLYLQTVGYDERTGTIQRPNLRYKDFVKKTMDTMERYAGSKNADTAKNIATQAARGGIRPSGAGRKGVTINDPSDISKLTDEQWEKNRDRINAEILRNIPK